MKAITVTCPNCGQTLRVAKSDSNHITCPSCFAAIENPLTGIAPRPVIPLNYQVQNDIGASQIALVVMWLLALTGALLVIASYGVQGLDGAMVLYLVLGTLALYVVIALFQPRPPPRSETNSPLPADIIQPRLAASRWHVWFFGGVITGIAISIIAWVVFWKSAISGMVIAIPAAKLVLGITTLFFRRWRAFGCGMLLSIGIGMLIFMGALVRDLAATPCKW